MDWQGLLTQIAIAAVPALIAYFCGLKRARAELEKLKAETRKIEVEPKVLGVEAAAALASGMSDFIEELRAECKGLRERVTALEAADVAKSVEIADLCRKLAAAEARIAELEAENKKLRETVKALQTENDHLRNRMANYAKRNGGD